MERDGPPVLKPKIAEAGFAVVDPLLTSAEVDALLAATAPLANELGEVGRGGVRGILRKTPGLARLVTHPGIGAMVGSILGPGAFAVRGLLFDKHEAANWKVAWHQDLTIAVQERRSVPGYGPWSVKAGVPHVQPPVDVLKRMLAVRVHLDECDADNGPVRVIPGSHRRGRLSAPEIAALRAEASEVPCLVGRGGILVMRPLLLHASAPARRPDHRRVVHLEFAACGLAGGLQWSERWPLTG